MASSRSNMARIQHVMSVTGVNAAMAWQLLEYSKLDVNAAIDCFFSSAERNEAAGAFDALKQNFDQEASSKDAKSLQPQKAKTEYHSLVQLDCSNGGESGARLMWILQRARNYILWTERIIKCSKTRCIFVVKKIFDDLVTEAFLELITWLVQVKHLEVVVEKQVMEDTSVTDRTEFFNIRNQLSVFKEGEHDASDKVDLLICLGGNGTVLYASGLFKTRCPTVMAFHLGSFGFITPFDFSSYKEQISHVLEGGETRCLKRMRLKCDILSENGTSKMTTPLNALNDVVINRGDALFCQIDLCLEDMHVTTIQGFGLVIATPTGSTAYSASTGASLVHPTLELIMISPVCPQLLSSRSIVVPADSEIKISLSANAPSNAWVIIDGRNRTEIVKGDVVTIKASEHPVPSLCCTDPTGDWFQSLSKCLNWNVHKIENPLQNNVV